MNIKLGIIKKKDIKLSYVFSWSGLLLFFFNIVIFYVSASLSIFKTLLAISIALLFIGAFYLCHKCKCPSCGFGQRGRFDSGFHTQLSLKKETVVCPVCKTIINLI